MKIAGEIIHEAGHALFVTMFGGKILGINISFEWPFTLSHTAWDLADPTNFQLAMIAIAGIIFDTITTIAGQSVLLRRKGMRPLMAISIFWLSFWSYLNSVVYLVVGAFQPFGDIQYLVGVVNIPKLWIGVLGFVLLAVYSYSLSIILRGVFLIVLDPKRATDMVPIFWVVLHLFFIMITIVQYGLPTPPTITATLLVMIFTWSYISGRWLMSLVYRLSGAGEGLRFTRFTWPRLRVLTTQGMDKERILRVGYIALFSFALASALLTGYMVNQYTSTYSLIMNTNIEVEAAYFELDLDQSVLNISVKVYNPTPGDLSLRRIEFDVKLNGKFMTHEIIRNLPSAPPEEQISFSQLVMLPSDRAFTLEEALREGKWDWTLQGTGYVETLFGETLLRFKCTSNVEPA
ncbi:MAG: hypothetical protein JSV18_07435 [Candidatus Bathyarchaeota archaeon]|nr:MAG: hypothetical protein JSV18_07435 [Candidatus Bathyarchaeota archaeon]